MPMSEGLLEAPPALMVPREEEGEGGPSRPGLIPLLRPQEGVQGCPVIRAVVAHGRLQVLIEGRGQRTGDTLGHEPGDGDGGPGYALGDAPRHVRADRRLEGGQGRESRKSGELQWPLQVRRLEAGELNPTKPWRVAKLRSG